MHHPHSVYKRSTHNQGELDGLKCSTHGIEEKNMQVFCGTTWRKKLFRNPDVDRLIIFILIISK
jgi:hypothetical protein